LPKGIIGESTVSKKIMSPGLARKSGKCSAAAPGGAGTGSGCIKAKTLPDTTEFKEDLKRLRTEAEIFLDREKEVLYIVVLNNSGAQYGA
jgi:hypothetical protein